MRNHVEKRKDMIESVLPSTARKMVRSDRARLHRRHRRSIGMQLAVGSNDPLGCDVRSEMAELVYRRRAADKVAPLERWAIAVIDRDEALVASAVDEQVDHFRRLLPATKIGRHALSHIELALRWRARPVSDFGEPAPAVRIEDVRRLYERGLHDELNRQLKQRQAMPRVLRGLDDIAGFVAAADPDVARIVARLLR